MPVRIVELLEMIKIKQHHREVFTVTLVVSNFTIESRRKSPAVINVGKRINGDLLLQFGLETAVHHPYNTQRQQRDVDDV